MDRNGVLYITDNKGWVYSLDGTQRSPGNSSVRPDYLGTVLEGSSNAVANRASMATDSLGNLYVSADERIYKVSPSTIDDNGELQLGALIGWMGRCTSDAAAGDQAVCDVTNERSVGFACTDDTCGGAGTRGDNPGQFDDPRGIAVDPNDVLYVTDFRNERVQRFSSEGFFAGQAVSECEGGCFVLGGFGSPNDIAVNSDHFYILDPNTDLLHVSLLTPFVEVGDDFAVLEYSSNNDFACALSSDCIDKFRFSVTDGVLDPDSGLPMRSASEKVRIEVARNFRPPFATPGIISIFDEDTPTPITLDGADLDPLDNLSFQITRQPEHGTISVSGDQATFTPELNFSGFDEFSFRASDGMSNSDPETIYVEIVNVNDPPVVDAEDEVTVARGFEIQIFGNIDDPDPEDTLTFSVDWGDGSPIEVEGEILDDGTRTGPILKQNPSGKGVLTSTHTYTSTGDYTFTQCVSDQVVKRGRMKVLSAKSTETCTETTVTVIDMVSLAIETSDSVDPIEAGDTVTYNVELINEPPDAGAGTAATGISAVFRLAPGLTHVSNDDGCTLQGSNVICRIDDINAGSSRSVAITTVSDAGLDIGTQLDNQVTVVLDQRNLLEGNQANELTSVSSSADFSVVAAEDLEDLNPGNGQCLDAEDACSLRAAIDELEAGSGGTIALGNGYFFMDLEDENAGNDFDVFGNLELLGNGAGKTIIQSDSTDRLFDVQPGATLTLRNLSLASGLADGEDGGAIRVRTAGALVLDGVSVSDSVAERGGAVFVDGGTATIRNSTFAGNQATANGGGLWLNGDVTLENVTVTGNRAESGGGIRIEGGSADLQFSTVSANEANTGGGISRTGGSLSLEASILADNTASQGKECSGTLSSAGRNLLGSLTDCSLSAQGSDMTDRSARLDEARPSSNGRLVQIPRANSRVIDAAGNSCPATDGRGIARPADGDNDGQAACDIGAVEADFASDFDQVFGNGFE